MKFTKDPDFDSSVDADGGFYVQPQKTDATGVTEKVLIVDANGQINRTEYTYSFEVDETPFYLGSSGINRSTSSRPTQDRVTMHLSLDENFKVEKTFSIRAD